MGHLGGFGKAKIFPSDSSSSSFRVALVIFGHWNCSQNNPVQFTMLSSNGCFFQNKHPLLELTLTFESSFAKET